MKRLKQQTSFIWMILLAIFMACDELPCEDSDGVQLNAGFYYYDGVSLKDTSLENISLHLGNTDSMLYTDTFAFAIQKINFPLSMLEDSSRLIIKFADTSADTLLFRYNKSLHLESHVCGFDEFFELTEIITTTHQIDSIWIRKDLVEYGEQENIKIYF